MNQSFADAVFANRKRWIASLGRNLLAEPWLNYQARTNFADHDTRYLGQAWDDTIRDAAERQDLTEITPE